jgi:hypothetical protein
MAADVNDDMTAYVDDDMAAYVDNDDVVAYVVNDDVAAYVDNDDVTNSRLLFQPRSPFQNYHCRIKLAKKPIVRSS